MKKQVQKISERERALLAEIEDLKKANVDLSDATLTLTCECGELAAERDALVCGRDAILCRLQRMLQMDTQKSAALEAQKNEIHRLTQMLEGLERYQWHQKARVVA